jgi:hypothetical protein
MRKLEDSIFIRLEYDEEKKILYHSWKKATENASWEQIKTEFLKFVNGVTSNKPIRLLIDERDMRHAYSPEEQEWIDENSAPKMIPSGVRKIAIVISKDGFVELATETMMEDGESKALNAKFFTSVEDGEKWLLS